MKKMLYLDCSSGISGDMTVAALLDLGADLTVLRRALDSLGVPGFQTEITRVKKAGLDVCDFAVKLDEAHENHDHDMEYLHGHHEHEHAHEHDHTHKQSHDHVHSHEHRGMAEISEILDRAKVTEQAREIAHRIFTILARAEAKAHGVPLDQVHFHEVGAVDSIVDVVAAAVCLDNLDIGEVIIPRLCEGSGTVRCQHGVLPVPVPAVVNIVEAEGICLQITNVAGELVTPTGAAIAAAIKTSDELPEEFLIKKTGLGAGKRTYERPSLLRAMLIEPKHRSGTDTVCCLETNVDDCTGETLGYLMDKLLAAGARDVSYTPVFMKKNRPAYQLNVICSREDVPALEQMIFAETTTIGIRRRKVERTVLKRESRSIRTPVGEAAVKVCTLPDGTKRFYPEYENAVSLAGSSGLPLREVYDAIDRSCRQSRSL